MWPEVRLRCYGREAGSAAASRRHATIAGSAATAST
jgi:hypothetical protein